MFSRRIILGTVAGSAVAVAVGVAVPAYALNTVNVTAGSAPSGTSVAFQAVSGTVTWRFSNTTAAGTCTSSTLTGTTKAGANSPSNLAYINGGSGQVIFTSCTILGLPFTVNGVGTAKWPIAVTGNTSSGTTPLNITGINLAIDSASCSFNVTGSLVASFVNGNPSKLAIPPATSATASLVVSNFTLKNGATKCLAGAVTNTSPSNRASVSATYNLSATNSAYNPVTAIAS